MFISGSLVQLIPSSFTSLLLRSYKCYVIQIYNVVVSSFLRSARPVTPHLPLTVLLQGKIAWNKQGKAKRFFCVLGSPDVVIFYLVIVSVYSQTHTRRFEFEFRVRVPSLQVLVSFPSSLLKTNNLDVWRHFYFYTEIHQVIRVQWYHVAILLASRAGEYQEYTRCSVELMILTQYYIHIYLVNRHYIPEQTLLTQKRWKPNLPRYAPSLATLRKESFRQ